MGIDLSTLVFETDRYLAAGQIADYCPNGLQVQGRPRVRRIVSGVTASQALLDAAVADNADLVLVHHGYFWRNEDPRVVGMKQRRLKTLLNHDISLVAYHLPLRSEEHTSELQSRENLVCRPLLEKKNERTPG